MREAFHDQLDSVFDDLAHMCGRVETAVSLATSALLTADSEIAEQVISDDKAIDQLREDLDEKAFSLMSLQAPVAGDLRVLVATLRMVADLERMGDLSVHVAKIARLRVPHVAVPDPVLPVVGRMAEAAKSMVGQAGNVIRSRDLDAASTLAQDDAEIDALRRETFAQMLGSDWAYGVEAAVDLALLGRYYERIADHAVAVARGVVFVATGEKQVFPDA